MSQTKPTTDLYHMRGDTFRRRFAIAIDGAPMDLTGATITFTLKEAITDADEAATHTLTIGSGITLVAGGSGVFDVELTAAQTAALSTSITYVWDCQIITATDSDVITPDYARGTLTLYADATQATS